MYIFNNNSRNNNNNNNKEDYHRCIVPTTGCQLGKMPRGDCIEPTEMPQSKQVIESKMSCFDDGKEEEMKKLFAYAPYYSVLPRNRYRASPPDDWFPATAHFFFFAAAGLRRSAVFHNIIKVISSIACSSSRNHFVGHTRAPACNFKWFLPVSRSIIYCMCVCVCVSPGRCVDTSYAFVDYWSHRSFRRHFTG